MCGAIVRSVHRTQLSKSLQEVCGGIIASVVQTEEEEGG